MSDPTPRELSRPRYRLLQWMQQLNFGVFEGLPIRDKEPVLEPRPRVIREVKLGADCGPQPHSHLKGFALKKQVLDLFSLFDNIVNGTIRRLEIKNGLPFRVEVEEADP